MDNGTRPIGWWLKHLDRLLEESFDRLLAKEHLARRHWQLLNAVKHGAAAPADVITALAPFWTPGSIEPAEVADELIRRGWLARHADGGVRLTEDGERAHAALSERVNANRRAVTDGFSREEYQAVVDALARMSANLQATPGAAAS